MKTNMAKLTWFVIQRYAKIKNIEERFNVDLKRGIWIFLAFLFAAKLLITGTFNSGRQGWKEHGNEEIIST